METEAESSRRFVSVKFDPVGRARRFLLTDVEFEPPLAPGDAVVVQRGERRAYATVTRAVGQLATRTAPPAASTDRVVRRASQQDITTKLKHQHREREAQRVAGMKIRERGLPMKLVRTEQLFDSPRLVFYFTAESRVDFRELVRSEPEVTSRLASGELDEIFDYGYYVRHVDETFERVGIA